MGGHHERRAGVPCWWVRVSLARQRSERTKQWRIQASKAQNLASASGSIWAAEVSMGQYYRLKQDAPGTFELSPLVAGTGGEEGQFPDSPETLAFTRSVSQISLTVYD